MAENKEETFKELERRLGTSGEWDRIMRVLLHRLNERGWLDNMRDQSKEKARSMEPLNFEQLMSDMLPNAIATVPQEVKQEVTSMLMVFFQRELQ